MNSIKNVSLIILIILFTVGCCFAQTPVDDKEVIKKAMYKSVIKDFPSECSAIDLEISTITLTFENEGLVEDVFIANLPSCLEANKVKLAEEIKSRINGLGLQAKDYKNKQVIMLLLFQVLPIVLGI